MRVINHHWQFYLEHIKKLSRAYWLPVKYPLRAIYGPPNSPTECAHSHS